MRPGGSLELASTAEANPLPRAEHAVPCDPIERHRRYLFNFAMGRVRDTNAAEDLVQETFLAAWKARDRYEKRCSERTWLVGILRHKVCDYFRYLSQQRSLAIDKSARQIESPNRHIEDKEFRESLILALAKLPPRTALVFQLYEVEDQSPGSVPEDEDLREQSLDNALSCTEASAPTPCRVAAASPARLKITARPLTS